jgi:dihydrofolate reductase
MSFAVRRGLIREPKTKAREIDVSKLIVTEFVTLDGVMYVDSSTLEEPLEWNNSTLIRGDVAGEVGKLKEQDGGPILVAGSATLVHTLIENDLVDELRLMVFPTALGGGKRLFGDSATSKAFQLIESRPVGADGVVILRYEPN